MDNERCCSHKVSTAITNRLLTIRYGQTVYNCQNTDYLWILVIGPCIPNARKRLENRICSSPHVEGGCVVLSWAPYEAICPSFSSHKGGPNWAHTSKK